MELMHFGSNLKKVRIKNGYTQQQLSDLLSISRETISKWERNQYFPNLEYIVEICNILNITIDDLCKGED